MGGWLEALNEQQAEDEYSVSRREECFTLPPFLYLDVLGPWGDLPDGIQLLVAEDC